MSSRRQSITQAPSALAMPRWNWGFTTCSAAAQPRWSWG